MRKVYLTKETMEMLSDPGLKSHPLAEFKPRSLPLPNGDYMEPMSERTIARLREAGLPGEGPNETIQRVIRLVLGKKPD